MLFGEFMVDNFNCIDFNNLMFFVMGVVFVVYICGFGIEYYDVLVFCIVVSIY